MSFFPFSSLLGDVVSEAVQEEGMEKRKNVDTYVRQRERGLLHLPSRSFPSRASARCQYLLVISCTDRTTNQGAHDREAHFACRYLHLQSLIAMLDDGTRVLR